MKFIDYYLHRITMYLLVFAGLVVLWVFALIFAITGSLSISPIGLMTSTIVLALSAVLSNMLLGLLVGVRALPTSAVITALILALIITPQTTVAGHVLLTITAVLAMASKYLLVYRRRHIFNPAAAGIFIASIFGLLYASWWVAAPPLFPAVALLTFLILRKVHKLTMGAVFIAVAGTTVVASQIVQYGDSLWQSVSVAALSWPIVFIAGFMLSEPLTSAPRRYQYLSIAVIVGLLVGLPFHIVGNLTMTPHLALLIGNAAGFIWAKRQGIRLRLNRVRSLGGRYTEYVFTPNRQFTFRPGQYLEMTIFHAPMDARGTRRIFSIVSSPTDSEVTIATHLPDKMSTFKRQLSQLQVDDIVPATGVYGDFVLPKDTGQKIVMIAGGIGITPFVSQIRDDQALQVSRDITLVYFVRSLEEAPYLDAFSDVADKLLVLDSKIVKVAGWHVVAKENYRTFIEKMIPDLSERKAYISGPPGLVDSLSHELRGKVDGLVTDHFSGY